MKRSLQIAWVLSFLVIAAHAQDRSCGPTAAIRSQLESVRVVVTGPSDFDRGLAPLVALHQRYPKDLWVNEGSMSAIRTQCSSTGLKATSEN